MAKDRAVGAELADRTIGPVDLVEIDVIGAQPLQALVDRLQDMRAAEFGRRAVVAKPGIRRTSDDLRGEDHLVAVPS
jgi:hypothetical protein